MTLPLECTSDLLLELKNLKRTEADVDNLLLLLDKINQEFSKIFNDIDEKDLKIFVNAYIGSFNLGKVNNEYNKKEYLKSLANLTTYIFLIQLTFYQTLSIQSPHLNLPYLNSSKNVSEIQKKIELASKLNKENILKINIVSLLKEDEMTLNRINFVLKCLDTLLFLDNQLDLVSFVIQRLIPIAYRKTISAFYTNPKSARLLANLAIDCSTISVMDPACGIGGVLTAVFERIVNIDHNLLPNNILENIYGSDIFPLAITLAKMNLFIHSHGESIPENHLIYSDIFDLEFSDIVPKTSEISEYKCLQATSIPKPIVNQTFPRVDLLIGNPPFTKGDRMSSDYKNYLIKQIKRRYKYSDKDLRRLVNKKQLGLHGYFLLDVLRYLKMNGSFAYILPYSTVYTESFEPIINELRKKIGFFFIIKSTNDVAFSDSHFEEIILIGKINYRGPIKIVNLLQPLKNKSLQEIDLLSEEIKNINHTSSSKDFSLRILPQDIFDKEKMTIYFFSEQFQELWNILKLHTLPIKNLANDLIRGNRVSPINFYGIPNKHWKIIEITEKYVKIQHKINLLILELSKKILRPTIKRYNEMAIYPSLLTKNLLQTYYIIPDEEDESYLKWKETNFTELHQAKGIHPPIVRYAHLAIPQKITWNSTKVLAVYSEEPIHIGDGFMAIIMDKNVSFWTYCFLQSSYGIFALKPLHRVISGSFGQILGPDLKFLRIPDFSVINKNKLEKIQDIVKKLGKIAINEKPTFMDAILEAKQNHQSLLYQLDYELTKCMGLEDNILDLLYDELLLLFKSRIS